MTAAPFGPVTVEVTPPFATVVMNDPGRNNRLSAELRAGVSGALADCAERPGVRAVVLGGLPGVFCSGGSPETMLGDRSVRIDAMWALLRGVLECPLPVVVAAQGHAFGGGLLLALCGDVVVLGDQSRYAANFLTYGFTPVLGATYIVPAALGTALGNEMLWTGRSYRGEELGRRGAGVTVARQVDVMGQGRRLAVRTARAPEDTLRRFKQQLMKSRLAAAEAALEREMADHETTIASPQVRSMMRGMWAGRSGTAPGSI